MRLPFARRDASSDIRRTDWQITAGVVTAAEVLTNFDNILSGADDLDTGFIVLQHDLYQQAVDLAVGYVLPQAATISPSLKLQPIIECLGKKMSDAYIETASTNATAGFPANAGAKPIAASPRAGSSGSGVILAVSPTAIPIGGATDVSCSLLGVVVAMMAVAVLK